MKKIGLLILALPLSLAGQTCSTLNPCVGVTLNNPSMAATVTTSPGGVEISGPGTATLFICKGAATTCTAASLAAAVGGATGVWTSVTFPQTKATVTYNDPEPYNTSVAYAVENSWTGGGTSPVSGMGTFQLPAPPQGAPGQANPPGTAVVTSGSTGPQ